MAIVQDILITIRGGRDDGIPSHLACPYCGQVDPEPSTHLARVHPVVTPLMEWCDVCPDPKIRHTAPGGACVACECSAFEPDRPFS